MPKSKSYLELLEAEVKTLESELKRVNHNFSVSSQIGAELTQKLAEKEKEIEELKKRKGHYASYLCKSDEKIEGWRTELTRIVADLEKTRSIFKSETIAALRKRLEKTAEEMKYFARGIANTVPISDLD